MRTLRNVSRRVLAGILGAAVLAWSVGAARAAEPVVLGCGSALNLKALMGKVGALAEKFVPGTGQQAMGMGAMIFQNPEWAGVDWTKPATVVLFGGKAFGKTEPVPVVLVTLADPAQFKNAHPEGGPASYEVRDNMAIVAQEKAAVAAITPQRFDLYSKYPKIAGTSDLYITVYVAQAIHEYQSDIDEGLKEAEKDAAGVQAAGPMAMAGKMIKVAAPLVALAGKEARRATLMLQLDENAIGITGRLYCEPDSALGTFFAGQPTETSDLAKYLPADVVIGASGKLDLTKAKPLIEAVLKAIAPPLELSAEDQDKVRSLIFASTQTGEFAVGVAGGAHQGMQTVQVARIADPAKFRAAAKDGLDWVMKSGLNTMLQGMGVQMTVDYKPAFREYKGVPVDRLTLTVAQAPGGQPNPAMPQTPPQLTEIAAIDTIGMASSNNPEGDLVNDVIDRVKGGGGPSLETSAAYKAATAAAPKGADTVGAFLFNSALAKLIEEVGKQQPGIALMAGGLIKPDPTEEPITTHSAFGADRVDFGIRIPHQPLLSLATRIRAMVQQQQAPGPKPKKEDDF